MTAERPLRRRRDDIPAYGDDALWSAMTEQLWHTMIVRVWRDRDGLKIRFTTEDRHQPPRPVAVEGSVDAACERFHAWLETVAPSAPEAVRRRRTQHDDAEETGEQTSAP